MDKINLYESNTNFHLNVEDGLKKLPSEVFKKILSYLNETELTSVDLVSHYWNKNISDIVRLDAFSNRNQFINFVLEHLENAELEGIKNDRTLLSLRSLKEVKLAVESSVECVTKILSCLDKTELKNLKKLCKIKVGKDFDNLLTIAELYKDLDWVNESDDRLYKVHKLQRIAMLLTVYRRNEKAVEVASEIPDNYEKALTIQGISDAMMQRGKLEKAIEIAEKIQVDYIRFESLDKISMLLLRKGSIERAIEVAKMMPDHLYTSRTLSRVGDYLLKEGKIVRAIDIYKGLVDRFYRYQGLEAAGTKLAETGRIEAAVDAIHLIDDAKVQQEAIQRVYLTLKSHLTKKIIW